AAKIFLKELLSKIPQPEKLIIGEPSVRENQWKENFRRHIREVLGELGYPDVAFFPEPFAVFQYYRNVESLFPSVTRPQNVLVVDVGGGTFNSCVIRTTERGFLARGGSTALPLGLQAEVHGGFEIDRKLLEVAVEKARKQGVKWKEDPLKRAEGEGMSILLLIEDTKIYLSTEIGSERRIADDVSNIKRKLTFPKGTIHQEEEISVELTGEDLKAILRNIWRKTWGPIVIETINEAKKKLANIKAKLDKTDLVLVAGGSARLPYMKEEITTLLPTMINAGSIYNGTDAGTAVALGIAWECKEQSARDPRLSLGRIAPCVLNDLYMGFRRSRRDAIELPKVRCNGKTNCLGQLLSSPFETEELTVHYEIEVPFPVKDKLYYYFGDHPLENTRDYLNHLNDVLAIQTNNKVSQKIELTLSIKQDGTIKPVFSFQEKGKGARRDKIRAECPEFYISDFGIIEGDSFCGVDFGSSNSYVARIISTEEVETGKEFPTFHLSQRTRKKLQELEEIIKIERDSGAFSMPKVLNRAKEQTLNIVFHSNKIEGNPLTKGETEDAITKYGEGAEISKNAREAVNMEQAYIWMLDNLAALRDGPQAFIRHLNKMVREGIDLDCGEYRSKKVTIGGTNYAPPPSMSVPPFMNQLDKEIKEWAEGRSPIEFATSMHTKLVWIHPFSDGNGRTARLLLNAILLCEKLPAIIINYADKSRYIDALEDSNKGNIDQLVAFFLECFDEEVSYLRQKNASGDIKPEEPISGEKQIPQPKAIKEKAIEEAIAEVSLRDFDDPLEIVLEIKREAVLREEMARFEASLQAFSTLLSETKALAEAIRSNPKYNYLGFSVNVKEHDVIDFDKYLATLAGGKVPSTWYFIVEICGPNGAEKLLLAFDQCKRADEKNGYDISIELLRYDGQEYIKLSSEPISLRYVFYSNGNLMFVNNDGSETEGRVRHEMALMVAEVIKGYL
ncbi:MAG: Fic family protein, partial [Thermodesulfobacteriota bacterium]|nr:Fic family protein [Thermodesulfobacteriota bacterium]